MRHNSIVRNEKRTMLLSAKSSSFEPGVLEFPLECFSFIVVCLQLLYLLAIE